MKKTTCYLFSLLLTFMVSSCQLSLHKEEWPSKEQVTKKYHVSPFDKIENHAAANIVFTQGNVCKVEAQGPENYIGHLVVSTKDNKLTIKLDNPKINFRSLKKNGVTFTVSAPTLTQVVQKGVGNITLKDSIQANNLNITNSGVGNISSDDLMCNQLTVSINGVGEINLNGSANSATYVSTGVGNLDVQNLKAQNVKATLSGVGSISCYASERISAHSKGVGNIEFYGNPQEKELNKRGIGSIKER